MEDFLNKPLLQEFSPHTLYSGEAILCKESMKLIVKPDSFLVISLATSTAIYQMKWQDILGAIPQSTKPKKGFTLIAFHKKSNTRILERFLFLTNDSDYWVLIIQSMCYFQKLPDEYEYDVYRRRFKVFLSQTSKALQIWRQVAPIFIACELAISRIQAHSQAVETTKTLDLSLYDGILVVGCDNLFHEVINALYKRSDGEQARLCPVFPISVGYNEEIAKILCKKSNEPFSPENCAFIAAKGTPLPIDITEIKPISSDEIIYSIYSFSWAFTADVEITSETCRVFRKTLNSAWRLISLKKYNASLKWTDEDGEHEHNDRFIYFLALNMSADCNGDDGKNDILVNSGDIGRKGLVHVLYKQRKGPKLGIDQLKHISASKWSLRPNSKRGIFSVDSQSYPVENIDAEVLKQYGTVFALTSLL
ncbi:ytlR_1 [Blepharisma stoltei]|uniref:DAGKc domain-containing protein n=1 Tax=Blepharisma stoltei TaxID=1481888 RepID=A0AAU9JH05_9CILI|nr:unnamed protein product [Blepharisma stoltei]